MHHRRTQSKPISTGRFLVAFVFVFVFAERTKRFRLCVPLKEEKKKSAHSRTSGGMAAAAATAATAAPAAAAPAQTIEGRLIAEIDQANPSVAVVRKVTGNMGAAPHQTIAHAALRMLQDVTLLAQVNPSMSPFQRILCLSCPLVFSSPPQRSKSGSHRHEKRLQQ